MWKAFSCHDVIMVNHGPIRRLYLGFDTTDIMDPKKQGVCTWRSGKKCTFQWWTKIFKGENELYIMSTLCQIINQSVWPMNHRTVLEKSYNIRQIAVHSNWHFTRLDMKVNISIQICPVSPSNKIIRMSRKLPLSDVKNACICKQITEITKFTHDTLLVVGMAYARMVHSPNLVAVRLLVGYQTWLQLAGDHLCDWLV